MFNSENFPQINYLKEQGITYLDSAATSLKVKSAIDMQQDFNTKFVSNVHRGAHKLSSIATDLFETSRNKTAQYLNAEISQIIFTKGTTEAINLIANTFAQTLSSKDHIVTTQMEHHANFIPWQQVALKTGCKISFCDITDEGELDLNHLEKILQEQPAQLVAFTQVSNTLGVVNPIEKIIQLSKKYGAKTFVDGAQGVCLEQPDLKKLDCDFYAFSAHKIFGPFGLGILYVKDTKEIQPYQYGGAIIDQVSMTETTFLKGPQKLEAGTPNISAIIGFSAVIDFLSSLNFDEIKSSEQKLLLALTESLKEIDGFKPLCTSKNKFNILSFNFEGVHANDLCELLDEQGLALRAGHHCAQPLFNRLKPNNSLRASFSIYNDLSDVEKLVEATKKSLRLLR